MRDHVNNLFKNTYPPRAFFFRESLYGSERDVMKEVVLYINNCISFWEIFNKKQYGKCQPLIEKMTCFINRAINTKFEDQFNILHILVYYDSSKIFGSSERKNFNRAKTHMYLGINVFASKAHDLINARNKYGQTPLARALVNIPDQPAKYHFQSIIALITIGANLIKVSENEMAKGKLTHLLQSYDSFELEVMYGIMVQCAEKSESLLKKQALLVYKLKHGTSQEIDILQYLASLAYKTNDCCIGIINLCAEIENPFLESKAICSPVELLVKNGCSLETTSHACGSTALILASKHGNQKLAKLLIDNGANLRTQNNQGKSSFDYAHSGGHTAILEMLENAEKKCTVVNL